MPEGEGRGTAVVEDEGGSGGARCVVRESTTTLAPFTATS
jgi:hypothetical protein